jgi:hypothetical protein
VGRPAAGSGDLLHGRVQVPERHQSHRKEPLARLFLHFCHRRVVGLSNQQRQRAILDLDELVGSEASGIGIDDLCPNAHLVHDPQPRRHVVRPRIDVIPLESRFDVPVPERLLHPVLLDYRGRPSRSSKNVVAVEIPRISTISITHAPRHPFLVFLGYTRRPEIRLLRYVRIGVYNFEARQRPTVQFFRYRHDESPFRRR